jgi:hypothetical protein
VFVYRWNIDRAIERGLFAETYGGRKNHEIIRNLQGSPAVSSQADGTRIHGDFVNCNGLIDTGGLFSTPIDDCVNMFFHHYPIDLDLSPGISFSVERDGSSAELYLPHGVEVGES